MDNVLYPWQFSAWQQLARLREFMPHAILFYGPEGIGKTTFVERFAQSLLCETPAVDGQPCDRCVSCGWFAQYSHPDYRRIRPEILDEGADTEDDDTAQTADVKKSSGKAAKAPSKEIKIDQVRALADFMNISTHRQGKRVIALYPAEALNTAAANSLLKTLEEPAPDTVFLLISNGIDRLLPTILSRCRKIALTVPSREEALRWLQAQGIDDADIWLSEQGGAPLTAHSLARSGSRETMDALLSHLAQPTIDGALKTAEKLQKVPTLELVAWLQRWLYDLFSVKLSGRIRYYPRYRKELAALAGRAETGALLNALKQANDRRAIAQHPLSPKLFIEDMLLDYSTIFS
jgi:DNA polymerase-3 subunit delta'